MTTARTTEAESSEEELETCVWKAKQVVYQIRDGMPGLKMRFGPTNRNIKRTPDTPSLVSSQLSQENLTVCNTT